MSTGHGASAARVLAVNPHSRPENPPRPPQPGSDPRTLSPACTTTSGHSRSRAYFAAHRTAVNDSTDPSTPTTAAPRYFAGAPIAGTRRPLFVSSRGSRLWIATRQRLQGPLLPSVPRHGLYPGPIGLDHPPGYARTTGAANMPAPGTPHSAVAAPNASTTSRPAPTSLDRTHRRVQPLNHAQAIHQLRDREHPAAGGNVGPGVR